MELFNAVFSPNYLKNKMVFEKGRTFFLCIVDCLLFSVSTPSPRACKHYHMLPLVCDVCCSLCPSNCFPLTVVSPSNQQMPGRPGAPQSERRPGSGSGMRLQ